MEGSFHPGSYVISAGVGKGIWEVGRLETLLTLLTRILGGEGLMIL